MPDDLTIPTFLRRQAPPQKEVSMAKPAKTEAVKPVVKATKPDTAAKAKGNTKLDTYGYREGSLKSKAAGMYGDKSGATAQEVKEALNSVQLNVLTDLEGKGYKVRRVKEDGSGNRQITRYFLEGK